MSFARLDVIMLDLMLTGRDGWSVIEAARSEGITIPIVVAVQALPSVGKQTPAMVLRLASLRGLAVFVLVVALRLLLTAGGQHKY